LNVVDLARAMYVSFRCCYVSSDGAFSRVAVAVLRVISDVL
jgi:hypothetical protein